VLAGLNAYAWHDSRRLLSRLVVGYGGGGLNAGKIVGFKYLRFFWIGG
jgi:hypothetical protein